MEPHTSDGRAAVFCPAAECTRRGLVE